MEKCAPPLRIEGAEDPRVTNKISHKKRSHMEANTSPISNPSPISYFGLPPHLKLSQKSQVPPSNPCFLFFSSSSPSSSSPPSMAMRTSHLVGILLWVSLLMLLVVHGLTDHLRLRHNTLPSHPATTNLNRKVLMTTKFDFSPFRAARHRQRTPPVVEDEPNPADSEIDPRYGVEKRLVPTGPNPLHH